MKTLNYFSFTILIIIIVLLMPTSKGIAQDPNEEIFIAEGAFPSISGDLIAYKRHLGPSEYLLCVYDLQTDLEIIVDTEYEILSPYIYGDVVVYQTSQFPELTCQLYAYDLSTGIKKLIHVYSDIGWYSYTEDSYSISGNRIVFLGSIYDWVTDTWYFNIYMHNLSTGSTTLIYSDLFWKRGICISENRIVWHQRDLSIPDWDIYMYDLSSGIKSSICSASGDQFRPAISGNRIIWEDGRHNDDFDIYMYDLATGMETPICTAPGWQRNPAIFGDLIVWGDDPGCDGVSDDIYLYDLARGIEVPICTASGEQCEPDISGNRIVWQDFRHITPAGIYLYEYKPDDFIGEIISGAGNVLVNDLPVSSFESFKLKVLDKVRTLDNSYADIEFGESTVNLDQNSSLKVAENSTQTNITLNEVYGRLKAKLKKLSPEQVEIRTPQAICGVRDTDVLIEANDYETQVIMLENDSDVSTLDESQSIVLEELQGVVVTADGIGEPFPVNPNEIDRWWYRMLISVASPVDLYVTDPLGRHIGYNPSEGIVNEIPGATYTGPSSVPELIDIPNPVLGNYEIDLTAVGTGAYHLSIAGMGMGDDTFYDEQSGSVETGEVVSYQTTCAETEVPMNVLIDIKPGSFPNAVNPNNWGVIPVSILTTDNFDAATVDPATVLFGAEGTEAEPIHHALEDVDLDGDIDMIFHFKTQDTGIQNGDTSAHLKGSSYNGKEFEGLDSITTIGSN